MRRTITVLQDDIDNGKPGRIRRCAIALAAGRDLADLPGADRVMVTGRIWGGEMRWRADMPGEAHAFQRLFDDGKPVEPFKFEVDIEFTGAGEDA